MNDSRTFETVALDLLKVASSERISRHLLRGLHHAELAEMVDVVSDSLIANLNAYVLSEQAGPVEQDQRVVLLPLRPKWLPKFLWRRIPVREARFRLSVTPTYIYPSSDVPVPALGAPVRIVVQRSDQDGLEWRV